MENKEFDEDGTEDQYLQKLSLRQYQIELSQISKKQNSIIFLPTGCGKTFIALSVLRSKMKDLVVSVDHGGKIAVFLGTTKVLVNQLAEVVKENTNLKVKTFLGEMGVDDWSVQTWQKETSDAQVLVMVPAIFLIIIQRNIVRPDAVALIVFDECHHAVLNHPYRQIMLEYESVPHNKRPLILGLTATVLNCNPIKDGLQEVNILKNTYNGNFAKTDLLEEALSYGTAAKELLIPYASSEKSVAEILIQNLINQVCDALNSLKIGGIVEKRAMAVMPRGSILLAKQNSVVKEIRNIFKHLERAVGDLGLYPTSIVALYYYIRLERLRLLKENPATVTLIKYALTVLNLIRRTVFKYVPMGDKNNIRKFSSKKLIALIEFINKYKKNDCLKCIVMVEEKITAVVLAEIFNELSRNGNSFYKAEFITGGLFTSVFDQEETKFEQKRMKAIISSFKNNEFYFLFATDVVEEGVDLQNCNLVIKFDIPKSYRSYIQSKGRARFKNSEYVILCNENNIVDLSGRLKKFSNTQKNLLKTLLTAEGINSEEEEKHPTNEKKEEVFYIKGENGPHITGTKAVSFIMRYCNRLPQDKFSFLAPVCWYDQKDKRAYLRLPASSPVQKTIVGDVRERRKLAKKNVFLKAVEELYKAGEILDDLTLRSYKCREEDHKELFDNVLKVSSGKLRSGSHGTKQKYKIEAKLISFILFHLTQKLFATNPVASSNRILQMVNDIVQSKIKYNICLDLIKYARSLSRCMPEPCSDSLIHIIQITPQFPRPENSRTGMFYDMLCDSNSFGILSSKRLSEICEFPLFLSMGDFKCSVVVNAATVFLQVSDMEKLKKFHFFIFNSLLRVVNRLQVFDNAGDSNSFFVVPVKYIEGEPIINWDLINDTVSRTQNAELSEMLIEKPQIEDFVKSVVYPKYRQISCTNRYYVVTSLDRSQTPMSTFPSEDFENYYEYFMSKYQLRIENKEQPLIEVKAISERINFIKPRKLPGSKGKRKYEQDGDNFKEHLVPELCVRISFPALFWLKATLLPSILYRVATISHIDEIRKTIASATKLGVCEKGSDFAWLPLQVEKQMIQEEEIRPLEWVYNTKQRMMKAQDKNPELQSPVDLFRHMNDCAPCDLFHYVKYFGLLKGEDDSPVSSAAEEECTKSVTVAEDPTIEFPDLPLFFDNPNEKGPELRDFVKVFTCKSANDIVDLEKLEFLGDSFLKFSSAFYVFRKFKDNEGVLVSIKDCIISNKNLYWCGIRKGFQEVLLANEFDPKSGWSAPLFCLPPEIEKLIDDETDSFEIEYLFEIPVKDKLSGILNSRTVKAIQNFVHSEEKRSVYTPDEIFLCRKTIPDKSIADCVEALLGLYLKECGLIAGFKMLNWLNILPETDGKYEAVMLNEYIYENKGDSEKVMESLNELYYEDIEKILGYEFKDKELLLEALTHPSVIDSLVPSYQRLEFLGDAIIDFILTLFIHHSCPDLPPGVMTDIRMSLVNNTTMACLAVKYNFHKYLIHQSPPLMVAISQFANFQRERNHEVDVAVNILSEEKEYKLSEAVEVPKALGDVFESLAGAIFIDSGNCLRTVWKSYYRLMKDIIELFIKDPPKSPIRILYEYCKPPPEFIYVTKDDGFVVATCKIIYCDKEYHFHGRSSSRQYSKLSAAKLAVAFLKGFVDEIPAAAQ